MNKMFREIIIFFAVLALLLSFGAKAQAETVTNGNFELTSSNPLFNLANALPGEEFHSDFTVKNIGSKTETLQIKLDITADPESLTEQIFLKIKNKNTGDCVLGCSGDLEIKNVNGTELAFSDIVSGEIKNYTFILTFDKNAGNEFQNAAMTFDMTIGYHTDIAPVALTVVSDNGDDDGDNDNKNRNRNRNQNNNNPGNPISGFRRIVTAQTSFVEEPTSGGQVAGEETPAGGQTEGVEVTACQGWPKWIWIVMFIIYILIFWKYLRKNYKAERVVWKFGLVWTVAVIILWYFFDKCREYQWFLYGTVIVAMVSYFFYLWMLKNKVKRPNISI